MITMEQVGQISPIFLTVTLMIYLILAELGHERIRKNLFPIIIALMAVFVVIAAMNIISQFR